MKVDEYERMSMAKLKRKNKSRGTLTLDMIAGRGSTDALGIASFYTAVQDKSETIGQLPVKLFRRKPDGTREKVTSGRMHRIFTLQPCEYMTMQGFLELMVVSLETRGAFYAYREKNDRGNVMSVIPFKNQNNVVPAMDVYGNVYYTYVRNDGRPGDPYSINDLVIITKFTEDGYTPVRPILRQATLMGIADAQDESYKEVQENGIASQMALSTDQAFVSDEAIQRLKDDWKPGGKFRGPAGVRSIPIFEQGMKPVSLKLTPKEADLINHQKFTTQQISNMVGVPMYRISPDSANVTKGVIQELDEYYMRNKLNPVLRKFEYAWNQLLPEDMHVEIDRKAFYAGSPHRLVEAVEKEVKGGLATINEGREDLGRERVEGADVFAIDSNNVTYGLWPDLPKMQDQIYGQRSESRDEE